MTKIDNYDFYSSRFLDFYLSGKISFVFMMNFLSLPVLLHLLRSNSSSNLTDELIFRNNSR